MPYKATYLIIWAPQTLSNLMAACDLFEMGKVLGFIEQIDVSFTGDPTPDMTEAAGLIEVLKDSGEQLKPKHFVSLVSLICVTSDEHIYLNKGKVLPYWNKQVRVISTGREWFMLHEFLAQQGYKVTTDQHMYVTDIEQRS